MIPRTDVEAYRRLKRKVVENLPTGKKKKKRKGKEEKKKEADEKTLGVVP